MARNRLRQLLIILAVPLLACVIYGRQVYLQIAHDLSVWKGGGMGMFAGIGAPHHRFLKIFLVDPLGQRIVTTRFTRAQSRLIAQVRAEPTDENFNRLLEALLTTRWKLLGQSLSGARLDSKGARIGVIRDLSPAIAPVSAQAPTALEIARGAPGWQPKKVEIEFWKIGYEIDTKRLFATRAKTFTANPPKGGR